MTRRRDPFPPRAECQAADPVAVPECRDERPARGRVPEPHGPVATGAGKEPAIWAERDTRDGAVVTGESASNGAGRHVPDLDLARPPLEGVVRPPGAAGRGELPSVGAEGDAQDVLRVPAEAGDFAPVAAFHSFTTPAWDSPGPYSSTRYPEPVASRAPSGE